MPLKYEVDSLDELDEGLREHYEQSDSGKYQLKVDGIDTGEELKGALQKEREERKRAKERLQELEEEQRKAREEAEKAREEAARKSGDTEALERSYQEKIEKIQAEMDKQLQQRDAMLHKQTVTSVAKSMASEIAVQGSAKALEPHIQSRLQMEMRDGEPKTVVLDDKGQPSAMTVEELREEISNDPAFAPLIAGSKASGGGASGGKGGGAAPSGDVRQMTREQKLDYYRQKRESA